MAIFVLPLNPFLYTFNLVMEKRAKRLETKLLKCLQAELEATIHAGETTGVRGPHHSTS
jgi:hypothetical protein